MRDPHTRSSLLLAINIPSVIVIIVYNLLQTYVYFNILYCKYSIEYRPIKNNINPTLLLFIILYTCVSSYSTILFIYFARTRATRRRHNHQGCLKRYIIIMNNALYYETRANLEF